MPKIGAVNGTCPICGGPMVRPSRTEQLRRWFNDGRGMGPHWHCPHCGEQDTMGLASYGAHSHSTAKCWLRLPLDVLRAVRAERRREPVPRFYALVMAAALVPAVVLARGSRHGWRALLMSPVAAWSGAFAWSLASAFPGGRAGDAVLGVVAPRAAARRMDLRDAEIARIAAATLPIVAPASWPGPLELGGVGYGEGRAGLVANQITIVAKPLAGTSRPELSIRVVAYSDPELDETALWELAAAEGEPAPAELWENDDGRVAERLQRWHARRHAELDRRVEQLAEQWQPAVVHLDGQPLPARAVHTAEQTLVACEIDGCRVAITIGAPTAEPVALVRVTDPEPLIADN